jgi:hypothetical protein
MAAGLIWAAACASNPRSAVPLEIPEPPPRVAIDPVPAVVEAPPVEKPVAATAPPRPPVVPPSAVPAAATTTPAAQPAPPATAAVEPPRSTPAPELRPAGATGRSPALAQVRESVVRAKQKLDGIDRRRLNAGQRADYDSARRFLAQAETAIKTNNLLLAESSVEKAETLADGLR